MSCSDPQFDFKRGSTMSLLLAIPDTVPDGFFSGWIPSAQIRRNRFDGPKGLVADLECMWNDEIVARHIILRHTMTDDWPLGLSELDVRLTSASGEVIQTSTMKLNIKRGITQ